MDSRDEKVGWELQRLIEGLLRLLHERGFRSRRQPKTQFPTASLLLALLGAFGGSWFTVRVVLGARIENIEKVTVDKVQQTIQDTSAHYWTVEADQLLAQLKGSQEETRQGLQRIKEQLGTVSAAQSAAEQAASETRALRALLEELGRDVEALESSITNTLAARSPLPSTTKQDAPEEPAVTPGSRPAPSTVP